MVQIVLVGVGAGIAAALLFVSPLGGTLLALPALSALRPADRDRRPGLEQPRRRDRRRRRRRERSPSPSPCPGGVVFLALFGAPMAWACRLAWLSRTDHRLGRSSSGIRPAASCFTQRRRRRSASIVVGFIIGYDPASFTAEITAALVDWLAQAPDTARAADRGRDRALRPLQRRGHAVHHGGACSSSSWSSICGSAARIAEASGRLARPRERLWTTVPAERGGRRLRRRGSSSPSFPASSAMLPARSTGAFGGALALIGLAVLHATTIGNSDPHPDPGRRLRGSLLLRRPADRPPRPPRHRRDLPSPPRPAAPRRPTRHLNNRKGESAMQVILLERIASLGQMGDVVRVRDGYARNFLLPQGKALRATKDNCQALRSGARPARGPQPRAQERGRRRRRQARRPVLHRRPPGRRDRSALRLGQRPRPRRHPDGRRLHGDPRARSSSTSRSRPSASIPSRSPSTPRSNRRSPSTSPGATTRRRARPAART